MTKRRVLNIIAVLSLLLFAATGALIVVSYDLSISYVSVEPQISPMQTVFLDHYSIGYFRSQSDYAYPKAGHHHANWLLPTLYPTGWHQSVPPTQLQPGRQPGIPRISLGPIAPVSNYRDDPHARLRDVSYHRPSLDPVGHLRAACPGLEHAAVEHAPPAQNQMLCRLRLRPHCQHQRAFAQSAGRRLSMRPQLQTATSEGNLAAASDCPRFSFGAAFSTKSVGYEQEVFRLSGKMTMT